MEKFSLHELFQMILEPVEMEKEGNYPENLFKQYKKLYKAGKFQEALKYLLHSVDEGFPEAMYELGRIYYFGDESMRLAQSYMEAHSFYYLAAKKGHEYAQYLLGFMYFKGEGAARDLEKALYWLNESANKGVNEALDLLGRIHHLGYDGIVRDYQKAEKFFQSAIKQGYASSMMHYALLLEEQQRFEEACELINKSVFLGNTEAIFNSMCMFK